MGDGLQLHCLWDVLLIAGACRFPTHLRLEEGVHHCRLPQAALPCMGIEREGRVSCAPTMPRGSRWACGIQDTLSCLAKLATPSSPPHLSAELLDTAGRALLSRRGSNGQQAGEMAGPLVPRHGGAGSAGHKLGSLTNGRTPQPACPHPLPRSRVRKHWPLLTSPPLFPCLAFCCSPSAISLAEPLIVPCTPRCPGV